MSEVVVAKTHEEVLAIRDDWTRIQEEYGIPTPNSDFERFLTTTRYLDAEVHPHVTLFREGDLPIALLAGRQTRSGGSCRIGYFKIRTPPLTNLEIVYGGAIVNGSNESLHKIVSYLRDQLDRSLVDHIMFNNLPVHHPLWAHLHATPIGVGAPLVRKLLHWETYLLDPASMEPIHLNSAKTRKKLRWTDRNLARHFDGDLELIVITETDQISQFIKAADAITKRTYQGAIGAGLRDTLIWRELLATMAERGNLRSYLLTGRGIVLAYVAGCVYGDRFTLESTAYHPEFSRLSPGTVIINRVFKDLAENEITTCDFGFGDAHYKRKYGQKNWEEGTLHFFGKASKARFTRLANQTTNLISNTVKKSIHSEKALGRIRKFLRKRLESK